MDILLVMMTVVTQCLIKRLDLIDGTNNVITFPREWNWNQCREYCWERNLNPWCFSFDETGERNEWSCAYSWQISYFRQFGVWENY